MRILPTCGRLAPGWEAYRFSHSCSNRSTSSRPDPPWAGACMGQWPVVPVCPVFGRILSRSVVRSSTGFRCAARTCSPMVAASPGICKPETWMPRGTPQHAPGVGEPERPGEALYRRCGALVDGLSRRQGAASCGFKAEILAEVERSGGPRMDPKGAPAGGCGLADGGLRQRADIPQNRSAPALSRGKRGCRFFGQPMKKVRAVSQDGRSTSPGYQRAV